MEIAMNLNGTTKCTEPNQEVYEEFETSSVRGPIRMIQYDYRDNDGELFSIVKPTLRECRCARERWLDMKALSALKNSMENAIR